MTQTAAKEWTPEQRQFMLWLALPKKARFPKTQQAFAKQVGVHETTLSDWKRQDGFAAEVKQMAVALIEDDVPEILHKIVAQAKAGSISHQQMALEMAGVYVQKSKNEFSGEVKLVVTYDG